MSPLKKHRYSIPTLLFLLAAFVVSCSSSNPDAPFDSDAGKHSADWADPFSIGAADFHATVVKEIHASSNGAVLFSRRCALCHGDNAAGKIGPNIRAVTAPEIANAVNIIPIMKGQAGLTSADIQDIAAYIATLRSGAAPVASVMNTEGCLSCHGADLRGGISAISCFSCHNGPDGSVGHPGGWTSAKNDPPDFHGSYGRRFSASCKNCHGVNFGGGIGPACVSCHNGTIAQVLDFVPVPTPQPGGTTITLTTTLNGAQEVPPVNTAGSGTAVITVNVDTGAVSGSLTFSGLSSNATAAHIHQAAAGSNGSVIIPLTGGAGSTSGTWTVPAGSVLTSAQLAALKANGLYVNVHTANNPAGEIRGQIVFTGITLTTSLNGAQEVPPVATSGTGNGVLTVNTSTLEISGTITFSGLSSNATAAHIHQAAAGSNGPVVVALTGGAGGASGTWTIPGGTLLTADQFNALRSDGLYFNIHTANNPAGEIRGQIVFRSAAITTTLNGAQEVPPVATAGTGVALLTVNTNTGAISGTLTFSGLSANATAAHIHQGAAGANGSVIIALTGGAGGTSGTWTVPAGSVLNSAQLDALKTNGLYLNIHTTANPAGEIRGQIIFSGVTITTSLNGAQEVPPVNTPGTAASILTVDLNTGAIGGTLTFSGLSANATAAHIHQGAAGANGSVIIALMGGAGGTSGTWTVPAGSVLNSSQLDALKANGLYLNIHTTANPAGEIRGQIIFAGP